MKFLIILLFTTISYSQTSDTLFVSYFGGTTLEVVKDTLVSNSGFKEDWMYKGTLGYYRFSKNKYGVKVLYYLYEEDIQKCIKSCKKLYWIPSYIDSYYIKSLKKAK